MSEDETTDEQFDLKLSGEGISIDKKIDRQTALDVMAAVMGGGVASGGARQAAHAGPFEQSAVQLSLREFLDEVKATRKPDQIVAIGHYICHQEGQPHFSRDDVKVRFLAAKEPMPANFPRDFGLTIRNAMIAEVHGNPGSFYVTKTGIAAVERNFAKGSKK